MTLRLALIVALCALVALGCSGSKKDDSPQREVEDAVRAFDKAIADADIETLISLTTESYFAAHFGHPDELATDVEEFGGPLGKQKAREVESVSIDGDNATLFSGQRGFEALNLDADEVRLQRRDGRWLVDYTGRRTTKPAGGAALIEMKLQDFSFDYRPDDFKRATPFVIRASNAGTQDHMVAIWRIPEGDELIKLVEATDGFPEGTERLINSQVFEPGETGDITMTKGLQPGRYMLVCFLNDKDEERTPHYDRGMITDSYVK